MSTELPLDVYGTVSLDADGAGSVVLGPAKFNERWEVQNVAFQVSSNNNEPVAKCYRDVVSDTTFINGSYSGSFDADPAFNQTIYPQRKIAVQWTGGDAFAVATVHLTGKMVFA